MRKFVLLVVAGLLLSAASVPIGASGSTTASIGSDAATTAQPSTAIQSFATETGVARTLVVGSAIINITIDDSSNGQDTETVPVTIEDQQSDEEQQNSTVPSDFPTSSEQYNAIVGDGERIDTFALVDAIEGASDDGVYNGVEFDTFDFVDIIQWNSDR